MHPRPLNARSASSSRRTNSSEFTTAQAREPGGRFLGTDRASVHLQQAEGVSMPGISRKIEQLKESSTLAFTGRGRELIAAGVDVIAMTAGEPDFQPPAHVLAAAREAIDLGLTKYTATEGTRELRQAVADKFRRENGLDYGLSSISVSTGGKQVLYNGFAAVLEPGDEVIIPEPFWVSYPAQVEMLGGTCVYLPSEAENGFIPDPEQLESLITPRTKVIVLNSPSNPTGAVYPREVVERFAEIAAEHDVWLFSDELYEHIVYEGEFTNPARTAPEHTLVIHGASKGYALTGWRIGWGAGPARLIKQMVKIQGQVTSGANAIAQHAAVAALNRHEETAAFQAETLAAYRERRDTLVAGLNRLGLQTPKPQGAFYTMTDTTELAPGGFDAAMRLLDEAHVAVVPGGGFNAPGRVRFSYATSLDRVEEAVARIGRLLGEN